MIIKNLLLQIKKHAQMSITAHAHWTSFSFDLNIDAPANKMMKMLFRGLLEASSAYYGDAIGLAPIGLSNKKNSEIKSTSFWNKDCQENPSRIACLNYESWTNEILKI